MLDVVRIIALTLAVIRSFRRRSAVGGAAGLLLAYGFAVIAVQVADAIAKAAVGAEYLSTRRVGPCDYDLSRQRRGNGTLSEPLSYCSR